jgi:hypothetical protein
LIFPSSYCSVWNFRFSNILLIACLCFVCKVLHSDVTVAHKEPKILSIGKACTK